MGERRSLRRGNCGRTVHPPKLHEDGAHAKDAQDAAHATYASDASHAKNAKDATYGLD